MHVFIDTPFSILVNVQVYIRGTVLKRYNMYNRSSLTFSGEKYIRNMILLEWKQLLMIIITKSIFYTSIDFESLNKLIPIFFMSVFPFFSFFFLCCHHTFVLQRRWRSQLDEKWRGITGTNDHRRSLLKLLQG